MGVKLIQSNNEEREREGNNHVRYNMTSLVHLDPLDMPVL